MEINVGGRVFTAARSTWASFSGTLLAGLVDERWQGQVLRDGCGRIFIASASADKFHMNHSHVILERRVCPRARLKVARISIHGFAVGARWF